MRTRVYHQRVVVQPVALNAHDCPECGVIYGITEEYESRRRDDGQRWVCPNGHGVSFNHSARQKLEDDLKRAEERLASEQGWTNKLTEDLHTERKQHATTKGKLTKTLHRIQAGVCPHCHRHFKALESHMQKKHAAPYPTPSVATTGSPA